MSGATDEPVLGTVEPLPDGLWERLVAHALDPSSAAAAEDLAGLVPDPADADTFDALDGLDGPGGLGDQPGDDTGDDTDGSTADDPWVDHQADEADPQEDWHSSGFDPGDEGGPGEG